MAELSPDDILILIDLYFDQMINTEQMKTLTAWLESSETNRDLFARMAMFQRQCRDLSRFEAEMNGSKSPLPDLEESRKIDEEVWQSILKDSIKAKQEAELEAKAQQMREDSLRLENHRRFGTQRGTKAGSEVRTIVIPRLAVWGGIAAALLLAAVLIVQFNGESAPPQQTVINQDIPVQPRETRPPPQAIYVASISAQQGAQWSHQHQSPGRDNRMLPGRYRLESGAVSVDLERGASVVVQAPCDFELVNDNRLKLDSGRVFATVPQQATGFTVVAAGLQIIDLGTEFGVDVDEAGRVRTAVMKGGVALRGEDDRESPVTLKSGESLDIQAGTALADAIKTSDLKALSLFARTVEDAADPYLAYRQAVLADKPVLYWDFEKITEDGVIKNAVDSDKFDGVIRGPVRLSSGQIGKAGAFHGDNSVQCDVVSSDSLFAGEGQTAYTVQLWVRMDRLQKSSIAALFQRDDSELAQHKHGMHFDLNGRGAAGQDTTMLRFVHRDPIWHTSEGGTRMQGDLAMEQSRWILLTAVKDREEIRIYADAALLMSAEDTQGVDGPVQLSIGSPGVGLEEGRLDFRTFAGQIDEVAVYDYALSKEQISNHYNLGQPQKQ